MNKRFLKYGLIAIVIIYASVLVSVIYNHQVGTKLETTNKSVKVNSRVHYTKTQLLVEEGAFFTPCLNSLGDKFIYSSGDNIYEMDIVTKAIKQLTYIGNCYNPVYYEKDNNTIAFARNDGIYIMDIAKNTTRKLVASNNPQVSYARPNFTMEGDIIYFKVTVLPKPEGYGFIEENPAIYRISKDGKNNEKIIDGYEPILFRDGKKLCYELKNNIYVIDLETRINKLIAVGKYASWSQDGNYISYVKFEKITIPYNLKQIKKLFIDKEFSNIFVTSVNNPKEKIKITKEEFENRDKELNRWANDLKHTNIDQHFLVSSKLIFFDSIWSKDNKCLYVSQYNGNKGGFELAKYNINIK